MNEQTSAVIVAPTTLQVSPAPVRWVGGGLPGRDGAPTKGRGMASCPGSAASVTRRSGAHLLGWV